MDGYSTGVQDTGEKLRIPSGFSEILFGAISAARPSQFLARPYHSRCNSLVLTAYSLNCHSEIAILRSSSLQIDTAQTHKSLSAGLFVCATSFCHFSVSAVDANGNLYVSDTFNNEVKEIVAVNRSIPSSPTILTLGSGFLEPEGLVLDKSGQTHITARF